VGYLLSAGGFYELVNGKNKLAASIGFGWGFSDDFLFFLNKPALFITATKLYTNESEWILTADFGFAINTPLFGFVTPHTEIGYAWKLQSAGNENGSKYAIGFDSETIPLGFTYAGLTVRLKYQFIFLNKTLHSPALELILH
jgi:hypothetical protein